MKRSARTALDEERHSVVYDAVQLVQSEQPAALDKLVQYTFFNATDALLDVLKKRPLLLLNLIQVNKAMYAFWNRVNGLWVVLADSLMASVAEDDAWVHVYAFYVLQARRERARLSELHRTLEWNELGASDISDRLKAKIDNDAARYDPRRLMRKGVLIKSMPVYGTVRVVIEWDPIIPLYAQLMTYLHYINRALPGPLRLDVSTASKRWIYGDYYQNHAPGQFLVLQEMIRRAQRVHDALNAFSHGPLIGSTVEITRHVDPEFSIEEQPRYNYDFDLDEPERPHTHRDFYPLEVARAIDVLSRLAAQLNYCIQQELARYPSQTQEGQIDYEAATTTLELTAERGMDFRRTLWHDVCSTPAEQHAMLMHMARGIALDKRSWVTEEHIRKLSCVACGDATSLVDSVAMMPACDSPSCRQFYARIVGADDAL